MMNRNRTPDKLVSHFLRANWLWPQTRAVVVFETGSCAVSSVLAGETDWNTLRASSVSRKQVRHLRNAAIAAHERYGVSVPADAFITTKRLGNLVRATMGATDTAATVFSKALLPYETAAFFARPWDPTNDSATHGVLFRRERNDDAFRPEAVAFGSMWRAAADLSRDEYAQSVAKDYREVVVKDRLNESSPSPMGGLSDEALDLMDQLGRHIIDSMVDVNLPAIEQETGVAIPSTLMLSTINVAFSGNVNS